MKTLLNELPPIGLLAGMEAGHREFLACFGQFLRPAAGDTVIAQGSRQENLYLILLGVVHVVFEGRGNAIPLARLGAGDALGEINVVEPSTASASVIARSDALLWRISHQDLKTFVEVDPVAGADLLARLLKLSGQRLRSMNRSLAEANEMKEAIRALSVRS